MSKDTIQWISWMERLRNSFSTAQALIVAVLKVIVGHNVLNLNQYWMALLECSAGVIQLKDGKTNTRK